MNTNLKKRVMARIYLIYTKNILLDNSGYFMIGIFVLTSFIFISIHDVFNNTINISKTSPISLFPFFVSAIIGTSWIIQILFALLFSRGVFFSFRKINKNINFNWFPIKLISRG